MEDLTERQSGILKFIIQEIRKKGYPPSVREIGKAVGLKSPASVHNHLKTPERLNYIRRDTSKPRAIEVLYGNEPEENDFEKEMVNVPLLGRVAAGAPVFAEENIEDYFPVPLEYIRSNGKELFMLKIEGESMINAGIHDGDFVIACRQNIANNGDIVVALLDDEATVKTFYKEENHIRLQPQNPALEPIIVSEVDILGKVVGLFRSLAP